MELVRYIHLNPLLAKRVGSIRELNSYAYSGHNVIVGKQKVEWQDVNKVLWMFNSKGSSARSLLCYWAVRELGMSLTDLAREFEMSAAEIGYEVERGEGIARENQYQLIS